MSNATRSARWRAKNPDYWKDWRSKHPDYWNGRKKNPITDPVKLEVRRKSERNYRRGYLALRRKDESYRKWKSEKDKAYGKTSKGRMRQFRASTKRRACGGDVKISHMDWSLILQVFGFACVYCGFDGNLVKDHFVPISKGGTTVISNIVPACVSCNSSKRDKMPLEFCKADTYLCVCAILRSL